MHVLLNIIKYILHIYANFIVYWNELKTKFIHHNNIFFDHKRHVLNILLHQNEDYHASYRSSPVHQILHDIDTSCLPGKFQTPSHSHHHKCLTHTFYPPK